MPSPLVQAPVKVGVVLLVKLLFAGAVRVTTGSVVSTVKVFVELAFGAARVAALKVSVEPVKVVPFQYVLSELRLMLTLREATPLASAAVPQIPIGLQPAL